MTTYKGYVKRNYTAFRNRAMSRTATYVEQAITHAKAMRLPISVTAQMGGYTSDLMALADGNARLAIRSGFGMKVPS